MLDAEVAEKLCLARIGLLGRMKFPRLSYGLCRSLIFPTRKVPDLLLLFTYAVHHDASDRAV